MIRKNLSLSLIFLSHPMVYSEKTNYSPPFMGGAGGGSAVSLYSKPLPQV